jgi:5'-nucleotidase
VEALPAEQSGPYLLPPKGTTDKVDAVHHPGTDASMEIKEWQALMNYLKSLPTKNENGVTVLAMDQRSNEDRSINARS